MTEVMSQRATDYQVALEEFRTLRANVDGFPDEMLEAATKLHAAWLALKTEWEAR